MSHRKPPLPAHYDNAPKGTCRWCNLPTGGKGRWHPACVVAFKLIHWPAETRKAVFKRDKGICARCGTDTCDWRTIPSAVRRFEDSSHTEEYRRAWAASHSGDRWQHDHIRPLVEAKGDISFWHLDNIATLCTACHQAKTAQEAAGRAAKRKALALTLALV